MNQFTTHIYIKRADAIPDYEVCRVVEQKGAGPDEAARSLVPDRKYSPVKGDKIWFSPECTVPRFKMKEFCKKYNVAIVKSRENATVVFVNDSTISQYVKSVHVPCYPKDSISRFLTVSGFNTPEFREMIDAIKESTSDVVSFYEHNIHASIGKLQETSLDYSKWVTLRILNKDYPEIVKVLEDPRVHHQDEILDKVNIGKVMTKDDYDSIRRFFKSGNKEDLIVAMEIMANCDYQKSAVYLLLLIMKFGDKIESSGKKHHVNFKSMLNFFNTAVNISLNDVIEILINKKLLDRTNLDRLIPAMVKDMQENACTDFYGPEGVVFAKEVEEALKENILDGEHNTEIVDDEVLEIKEVFND